MADPARTVPSRAVIVTGGAAGIGWATVRRFAAAGDRVAILDRDAATAAARAAELGGEHVALAVDIADEAALVNAIDAVRQRFGRLDVLVNNAATIYIGGGPTLAMSIAGFERLMSVNASGAAVAAREAARIMRAQGDGGAIVNLASLVAVVAVPHRTAYSISKAAVMGLTRALAAEHAASAIRVNAVLPGFTATETFRESQRTRGVDARKTERRIPLGRMAEPEEIAAAVFHLASPDARFTRGAMLTVDGGFGIYGGIDDVSEGGVAPPRPRGEPRVALIAGAASAAGVAIAHRLAAGGARLVLLDEDADALATATAGLSPAPITVATGAIDAPGAAAAVTAAVARFGRIDLLVNAADSRPSASFGAMVDDCLSQALVVAQAAVPTMIGQRAGAIVNCCPPVAAAAGDAGRWAARTGMAALTRSLACEWAGNGIRVNAVAPVAGAPAIAVAGPVAFLGSDDASYVTGATYVAGGAG